MDRGFETMSSGNVSVFKVVALIVAIILIGAGLAMLFSDDIITKIEGIIAAPLLIGGGVAIIVALVREE